MKLHHFVSKLFQKIYSYKRTLLWFFVLVVSYYFFYELYIPRMYAFGCFDDCFNIVAGHLLLSGKKLYSDIFFNHQMGMAYLSAIIQYIFDPSHIADLIFRHRQVIIGLGFVANGLLVIRYGVVGLLFALLYETSKFYVFGDRFLAEGLIVYPLVYMFGLGLSIILKKRLYSVDVIFAGMCAWIVFVMREPYVPVAVLLFFYIVIKGKFSVLYKKIAIVSSVVLCVFSLLVHSAEDYFFNLFTANFQTILASDISSQSSFFYLLLKIFFYPFYVVFSIEYSNPFWFFVSLLCVSLLYLSIVLVKKKKVAIVLFVLFFLAVSNPRPVDVGTIYYEAFHIAPWYGMLIFAFLFLLFRAVITKIRFGLGLLVGFVFIVAFFIQQSFIHDDIDRHATFLTQYGNYEHVSRVVSLVAKPDSTFFVDGFDELIMWNADASSPYKYAWYTSVMPYLEKYNTAREEMFSEYPPDIYYGNCLGEEDALVRKIPSYARSDYVRLLNNNVESCLYFHSSFVSTLDKATFNAIGEHLYTIPSFETGIDTAM